MAKYLLLLFSCIIPTLSAEPKDPPKNVIVSVIPEEVNRVKVTFTPPEEPNGNITAYFVYIYEKDRLVKNISLNITQDSKNQNMLTAVIEGLKGGHSYSIQVNTHTGMFRHALMVWSWNGRIISPHPLQVVQIVIFFLLTPFCAVPLPAVFLPFFYLSV